MSGDKELLLTLLAWLVACSVGPPSIEKSDKVTLIGRKLHVHHICLLPPLPGAEHSEDGLPCNQCYAGQHPLPIAQLTSNQDRSWEQLSSFPGLVILPSSLTAASSFSCLDSWVDIIQAGQSGLSQLWVLFDSDLWSVSSKTLQSPSQPRDGDTSLCIIGCQN